MWWNWNTRDIQNVVPKGMRVRVSLWPLFFDREIKSTEELKIELSKKQEFDSTNKLQTSWDSLGFHKADLFGSIPKSATGESSQKKFFHNPLRKRGNVTYHDTVS